MKRPYDTKLLFIGIYLILAQIASFTLQNYFGSAHLTVVPGLDIALNFLIAFFLIAQFRKFHQATSIVVMVYAGLNLFYAFIARSLTERYFDDINMSVFFVLSLLIAYALFAISAIFLMIHVTQKRFEDAFTFKLVGTSLGVTLVLLIVAAIFITPLYTVDIITAVLTLISLAVLFLAIIFIVKSPTIEYESPLPREKKVEVDEVEDLYKRGIITEEEYHIKKDKLK